MNQCTEHNPSSMKRLRWAPLALLLILILLASKCEECDRDDKYGKSTLYGMESKILLVSRTWGDNIDIEYILIRIDPDSPWLLDPAEPVNLHFWKGTKKWINKNDTTSVFVPLSPEFLEGTDTTNTVIIANVVVPPGATHVAVALGSSGLETELYELPPR
jgi:hypothetical protein